MKIGIDARMLGPEQGGIGRYIQQIITNFNTETLQHANTVNFIVFLRQNNWNLVPESPNIKKVLADIPWYGWREQFLLPKILKKEKVDLMHFPHWNIPLFYNEPFAVTIHDLLLLHFPTRASSTLGPITYFFKNLAYRTVLNHAIKKAKQIITPSEFTKNDIIKTFNIPAEKITAIHLAPTTVDSRLTIDYNNFQTIADKYKISKPYVLYVGVAYPHKNLEGLVEAWKMFCAEHGNNYQLVLAGRKNYFYERLENSTKALQHQNAAAPVVFTGFVPDEELPVLYQNASLYVFPSFYEGFGLPPLEAMQWGVPVVSSNAACLPEILGNAAEYFDPHDFQAINMAISRGISDDNLRRTLKLNGEKLIHNYDWKKTARITLAVYGKVL